MIDNTPNLTVGKGRLYFTQAGTTGERFFGNVPGFTVSIASESLDHFSSTGGIKQKDDSLAISTTRTGTLTTDNMSTENVALFFFGTTSKITTVSTTVTDEAHADVVQGLYYQLGVSDLTPSGARGLVEHSVGVNAVVKVAAATQVEGTDYEIEMETGRLYIVPGGGIADLADITVSYKIGAGTRDQIISGDDVVQGALRFVADNPKGKNRDVLMPNVKISPNGEFAPIGDDWQSIQFNLEVLKLANRAAIYVDGRPV